MSSPLVPEVSPASVFLDYTDCFNSSQQSTVLTGHEFGGVPTVLGIHICVFLVLLLIFSLVREKVWDFGRSALFSDNDTKKVPGMRLSSVFTESFRHHRGRKPSVEANKKDPKNESKFCSWLPYILNMTEEEIENKCGVDAANYLSFLRHLTVLLAFVTVCSLCVILPVNMTGDLLSNDEQKFGQTTIGNLQSRNNLYWLHSGCAVLYLALTVLLLRRYTLKIKKNREKGRTILFVCPVPKTAKDEDVKTHFVEAYPSYEVCNVTLGYDVAKLMHLDKKRQRAGKNLRYYEDILEEKEEREKINPHFCGFCGCCCANCEKVDAIEYYSNKENELKEKVTKMTKEQQHPLGIAFVKVKTKAMANNILKDFNAVDCSNSSCCEKKPQPSSKSKTLNVNKWKVRYSPRYQNIFWQNLSVQGFPWYARCVMLNIFVFLLLTFLTTPTIILNTMDKYNVTKPISELNSPIISQFFPTFLLWFFSALLPTIVYYSTLGEAHWSRTREQLSIMRKLYFFLLFMLLLLPSLGLTSLAVFLRWLFDKEFLKEGKMRFECVFLPNQGAFFVNYVIAAALVGSAMELFQLPRLLVYVIRMLFARSSAERQYIKENQANEFEYGAMYGWILCVFTIIMAYSVICPIITPFGLLYMILKYFVGRYHLYFTYRPTNIALKVHLEAVNQALAAPIISLIWLYFFSVLRAVILVILVITVLVYAIYTCSSHFQYLCPSNYVVKEEEEEDLNGTAFRLSTRLSLNKPLNRVDGEDAEEDTEVYLPNILQQAYSSTQDNTGHGFISED
ncbi:CSC1-like protein 1 isoform 2-T2 [Pholidichthys leucotaenia]